MDGAICTRVAFGVTRREGSRYLQGITLIGRLFEEGTLGRVGIALERAFAVAAERPPSF